ncbi:hypothetical protein I862_06870 [endosymbiont of Acanthamoeba sp. UWC8]|uniref:sulfite exporter TauE/SafE family protein n=1 Tax=endosymbiont of Acanthamoeba sp. UWC8 TaxID=86106 RepID=UPI0004D15E05|nr:sulfite exporter TauE/SafE family protein [endosymbiont of Acanthamoeba sp. UWC8]AIF81928.1 hypothetical protein I862_06870 [endosymbiont of Acanthamoeba sp. UWC8]
MAHCEHHHNHSSFNINEILSFLGLDAGGEGLILTLFLTGLAASFTHCIGMCGPIALTQMSMRLMHLPKEKMQEKYKLNAALSLPYYFGKAFTYVVLMLIAMIFSKSIKNIPYIKWAALILLMITALLFIKSGITKTFQLFDLKLPFKNKLDNFFAGKVSKLNLSPFGFKGLIMGMILGLIPCGIVYASIITVISRTDSYFTATIAMFMFGLATIPGLFLVSYLGGQILSSKKAIFNSLYSLMMFVNAYLIISYAFNLTSQ